MSSPLHPQAAPLSRTTLRSATAVALCGALLPLIVGTCQRQPEAHRAAPPALVARPSAPVEPLSPPVTVTQVVAQLDLGASGSLRPRFQGSPARAAFDARQWAQCASGFGRAAASAPWQARALQLLCIQRAGKPAQVALSFERLGDSGGLLAAYGWLWAGQAWLEANQPAKAAAAIGRIDLNAFARAPRARVVLAQALTKLNKTTQAAETWAAALTATSAPIHVFAAVSVMKAAGQGAEARSALHRLMRRLQPKEIEDRALALLAELDDGAKSLPVATLLARATAAKGAQKRKLAMALAAEVMEKSAPGDAHWCAAGMVRAKVMEIFWKRRKEAAAFYQSLVDKCPKTPASAKLWYRAGKRIALSASGDDALKVFDRVLKIAPTSTLVDDTLRLQARVHDKAGRAKKAVALRWQAIEFQGDMSNYLGWDLLWARVRADDWRGAVRVAKRLSGVKLARPHAYNVGRISYWHGYALWKLRKKRAAIKRWRAIVQSSPWSWYGMMSYLRLKQLKAKGVEALVAGWRSTEVKSRALTEIFEGMRDDRHLLAAIELTRMGLMTSAKAELSRVDWKPAGADAYMMRSALHAAVGEVTKSVAATFRGAELGAEPPSGAALRRWQLAYPRPKAFLAKVQAESSRHGVDPAFVWSIMRSESRFNPRIQSPVLATGLLQLMLATAKGQNRRLGAPFKVSYGSLKRPEVNIPLGVAFMARLRQVSGDHWAMVASAYNAGPGNNRRWRKKWPKMELDRFVESVPFKENRRYIKAVLTSWSRYRGLYGEEAMSAPSMTLPSR